MKTYLAKKETVQPKWYLVDAEGQVLGRLAVKLANLAADISGVNPKEHGHQTMSSLFKEIREDAAARRREDGLDPPQEQTPEQGRER